MNQSLERGSSPQPDHSQAQDYITGIFRDLDPRQVVGYLEETRGDLVATARLCLSSLGITNLEDQKPVLHRIHQDSEGMHY